MSYIYPPDRNDYFESTYLPQIGASTQYDFYQAPSEPGEPLIPYGWRSDWNRPNGGARFDWTTMSSPGVVHSLPTLSTGAFTSNGSTLPALHAHTTLHTLPTTSTATMGLQMNGTPLNTVHLTGLPSSTSSLPPSLPSTNPHSLPSVTGLNAHISYGASVKPLSSVSRSILKVSRKETTKPFPCHICGKSFSQAANLTAHKRVHTGEKPFSCSVCQRPFSQSSSLVTHKRTHTGERPYPCPHCDKAFTDSSTLTKHLRTHTGLKPYSCPMCLMRFTQSGNLHRHMKTHRSSK